MSAATAGRELPTAVREGSTAMHRQGQKRSRDEASGVPDSYERSVFFYAEVTTARLHAMSPLFDSGNVIPHMGFVLPLAGVRAAHEMLAGAPHRRGKILRQVAT